MGRQNLKRVAVVQLVLILPAAVFMSAVMARYLPATRQPAQHVVMLYAGRMWTLWILLLALPIGVLFGGCVTLLREWALVGEGANAGGQSQVPSRHVLGTWLVAATTVIAAGILAVVVLHMLAN